MGASRQSFTASDESARLNRGPSIVGLSEHEPDFTQGRGIAAGVMLAHNKTPESDVKPLRRALIQSEIKRKNAWDGSKNRPREASRRKGWRACKRTDRCIKNGGVVVHPLSNHFRITRTVAMTGIDPRHRPHYLSLLPSGPDEVRNRLLRGGRSG